MKRQLTNPNKDTTIVNTLQVYEGGTGATTVAQAQINLDILPASRLGQPGGPAMLPLSGSLSGGMFEGGVDLSATLSGPVSVMVSTTNTYLITNYDVKTAYVVTATGGSVMVAGDTITYIANSVMEVGTITINGKVFEIPKIDQVPATPVVTSPVDNAVDVGSSVVYTASAFSTEKVGDTHANSDWEVASDSGFMTIVASSYADATNKTGWTASGLAVSTTYYMRVRYRSSTGKVSAWSATKVFSTKANFIPTGERQKLTASDAATSDTFGYSVSISSDGSTAIVGARGKSSSTGAAYIFTRSGTIWTQQQTLTASDAAASDYFGQSVSISSDGSTAIVGAWGKSSYTGAAYIFTRSGSTWTQQQKLTASNAAGGDYFGGSVSLTSDGSTALIGAAYKSSLTGAAYVFTRSGSTWTQQAWLVASDNDISDTFGYSVSISSNGSTAIVGAWGKSSSTGAAYIFIRSGSTWTEQQKLVASGAAGGDRFGYSVSISSDGSTVIVGAYWEDPSAISNAGAAYVYTRSGSTWTQQAKLTASDPATNDYFGGSVTISSDGSTAVICAYFKSSSTGAAYIFTRLGSTWTQQAKLTASDAATNDSFGYSVSISSDGSTALIGAAYKSSSTGAAYIYG